MSKYMEETYPIIDATHEMRVELLDALDDRDLAFTPGGDALTFGALIREMGEIQYAYVESLKTFRQDWNYHNTTPGLESSLEQLKAWFAALDEEMKTIVGGFSDADFDKPITRDSGYEAPVRMQLDFYVQAALIFFGKATIYLRVMGKPLPQSLKDWVW